MLQLHINVTNVKIVMFIELNNKDAYCAHENAKDVKDVENINAFMNMSQLKVTQIWNMRLNEYLKYWSLKALKSVTVTLYKLQMLSLLKTFFTESLSLESVAISLSLWISVCSTALRFDDDDVLKLLIWRRFFCNIT